MASVSDDPIAAPIHYRGDGKIQAMDAMRSMVSIADTSAIQSFWWCGAFKYLWRWHMKNGIEDLEKCKQCIDYLIAETNEE